MFKKNFIINLFLIFFFQINAILADAFDAKIDEIRAEINRNDLKSAINLLEKIKVGNDTQQDKVHILYGDIYLKINQTIKAEEFYEKAFFTTNKYVESLSLVGLAEVKLIQGKIDKSIRLSKQAISINPDLIRPKIILSTALTRICEGQQAIEILQDLYDNQKTAAVSLAISDYYFAFNDIDAAVNILENYLKRNPNHIRVLDQIAGLYLFKGEKQKAIENFKKVIEINSQYTNAYNNLGLVYSSMGFYKEAVNSFIKTLELEKDNPVAKKSLIYLLTYYSTNDNHPLIIANNNLKKIQKKLLLEMELV